MAEARLNIFTRWTQAGFLLVLALFSGSVAAQSGGGAPFNHASTGFMLEGAHLRERCESCHVQGLFRGTPRDCASCHRPGGRAPGKAPSHVPTTTACDACHLSSSWTPTSFRHRSNQGVAVGACATCHNGSTAQGKHAGHVITSAACDSCHKTSAWLPAGYTHAMVVPGTCATCHNGARATGKSARHIPTTASCDGCHGIGTTFSPVSVATATLHAKMAGPVAAANCSTCHSGGFVTQNAQQKSANHVATSEQCDACHTSTSTWAMANFDHTLVSPPVTGICSSCHGVSALGKTTSHIPTAQQCDVCHTNFTAFKPVQMNHFGTAGQCVSCHSGAFTYANAQAKSVSHLPTTAQCDSCHVNGFVTWSPATMNHAGTAGKCITCHTGGFIAQNAQIKPATHIPTTAQCDSCHQSTTTWATRIFNHELTSPPAAGRCNTCHNGTTALGKPTNHLPTTAQCDSCHNNFNAFRPAPMNHAGTTGQCNSCHNGTYLYAGAIARPIGHIPASGQCDTCHRAGFVSWSPATMNHAGLAGVCAACHSGAYLVQNAQVKPATHIATTAQCDSCHNSTTSWALATLNHANVTPAVAGRCSTCHNGTQALGKPTNHVPTSGQCDSCHNNFTAFAPATMNHANTAGQCDSCHNSRFLFSGALAKHATHVPTTAQCDTCHKSTISWAGATFGHPATAAGTCSTCHNGTTAVGKSATHIPVALQCDNCHGNFNAFSPALMNHAGLVGQCASCHSGAFVAVNARAKPVTHVPTTAQCDLCHVGGFVAFAPSTMNHAGTAGPVSAGNCATCHSGAFTAQNAQVKPATHIVTTAQCDSCHNSTTSWATATFNHATATPAVAGRCSSCHNGTNGLGKPAIHVPTTSQCDTCHTNFTAFTPATMNHAATAGPAAAGNCASCHNGAFVFAHADAKSASHIPTSGQCDSCHLGGFVNWTPATMNHAGLAGTCANCHNGAYLAQNAQAKTPTHIVTTAQCDSCHNSTTSWATATLNHAIVTPSVTGRCSTCHNGTTALGKPTNHIPTSGQCDSCHANFTAFAPATMNHANTTAQCDSCHNGRFLFANALAKNATHVVTAAQCDTCHKSTTVWTGAVFAHPATAAGTCSNCHNGATAAGKTATHIPTTLQCDSCHNNYVAFRPALMNHAGLAGQCTSCHSGNFVAANARAKPVTHLPTTAQCDLCHINGFIAFAPSSMNHAATAGPLAAGNCATCHSGAFVAQNAQIKPPTHISTTAQCDSCHASTTSWATATFNHATATPAVAGRCSTCHNGTSALGKPTNHLPTTAQCDVCHSGFVAFAPATVNHAGTTGPLAAGNCATCHNGSFVAVHAVAKPATHIVTVQSCDSCHNTVAWKPTSFSHAGVVAGSCATCHNGTTARGKLATHLPTATACDACHTNFVTFAPATMNHAATTAPLATGNCSTCHSGAFLSINAQVKHATHVATTAQCDSCHTSTTTWARATFTHDTTATGRCANCHNSTNALGKPTTHIPTTTQCDTCHTNFVAFRPATMSHAGTTGPVAAGNCATCHSGTYVSVNALAKPAGHIPTTAQCDRCHTRGFVTWAPAVMNHTGLAGQCSTCHSGAYLAQNALSKPPTHIVTTAQCDSCHNSTTTWATGTFNHSTAVPSVAGRCSTCHNATVSIGKPSLHVPTTAQCDVCHKNFTAFGPATMSHAGTTGPLAAGNCSACHSGAYTSSNAVGKPATHLATVQQCDVCHTTTVWKPTSFSHTGVTPGTCTTCHNGIAAVSKPTLHIPTTQSCDVCHRTGVAWLPVITPFAHTGVVAGSCVSCHVATFPNISAKPTLHVPTTAACDACHHSFTAWLPTTYNHAGIATNSCQTCHGGAYPNITIKPTNHVPTTSPAGSVGNECSRCHTSTTNFLTGTMQHGTMQTGCRTCHLSTATYQGTMDKKGTSHENMGTKDCSSSGCHRPLGSRGTAYTRWD